MQFFVLLAGMNICDYKIIDKLINNEPNIIYIPINVPKHNLRSREFLRIELHRLHRSNNVFTRRVFFNYNKKA